MSDYEWWNDRCKQTLGTFCDCVFRRNPGILKSFPSVFCAYITRDKAAEYTNGQALSKEQVCAVKNDIFLYLLILRIFVKKKEPWETASKLTLCDWGYQATDISNYTLPADVRDITDGATNKDILTAFGFELKDDHLGYRKIHCRPAVTIGSTKLKETFQAKTFTWSWKFEHYYTIEQRKGDALFSPIAREEIFRLTEENAELEEQAASRQEEMKRLKKKLQMLTRVIENAAAAEASLRDLVLVPLGLDIDELGLDLSAMGLEPSKVRKTSLKTDALFEEYDKDMMQSAILQSRIIPESAQSFFDDEKVNTAEFLLQAAKYQLATSNGDATAQRSARMTALVDPNANLTEVQVYRMLAVDFGSHFDVVDVNSPRSIEEWRRMATRLVGGIIQSRDNAAARAALEHPNLVSVVYVDPGHWYVLRKIGAQLYATDSLKNKYRKMSLEEALENLKATAFYCFKKDKADFETLLQERQKGNLTCGVSAVNMGIGKQKWTWEFNGTQITGAGEAFNADLESQGPRAAYNVNGDRVKGF
jgi:hypothetical protein